MSAERRVILHPDKESLAAGVAARFITKVVDLVAEFGEASIVLTGGAMGRKVLEAINASPARDLIDWPRVNVWWGDERWVPAGHPDRNDVQARAALLDHVPVDASRVHQFACSDSGVDLDAAADAYAREIDSETWANGPTQRFDITFLGMGPDGHVASLFPERGGIREGGKTVISVRKSPKPPSERLSLTLPAINSSAHVWLVVAGADKASALGLTLAGASINEVPAAGVEGTRKTVFFVDADAAQEVAANLIDPGQFWTGQDDKV